MLKQSTKRYQYICANDSKYLNLSGTRCSPAVSVPLHKHSQTSQKKKDFYTIITTAPSPFIFIVYIKGKKECIRAHFGSRGEAISTVSQRESKTSFIL